MAGPCGARTSRRGRVVTRVARVGVWCTAGLVASWIAFRAAGIEMRAGPFLLYCIVMFATGLTMDFLERRAADPRTAAGVVAAGATAGEVIDALVEAVGAAVGGHDAEAVRRAVRDAVSGLLERFPDADLLGLSEERILLVVEDFAANDWSS